MKPLNRELYPPIHMAVLILDSPGLAHTHGRLNLVLSQVDSELINLACKQDPDPDSLTRLCNTRIQCVNR